MTISKKIKLTQDKYALVDSADFDWLNQWKWTLDSTGYAYRNEYLGGGRKSQKLRHILMHRLVNQTPDGLITDHINRNRIDNRRSNLRTVTVSQNVINTGLRKDNASGHKGVYWYPSSKKWGAEIRVNYKKITLGRYSDIELAIKAREKAERIYQTV